MLKKVFTFTFTLTVILGIWFFISPAQEVFATGITIPTGTGLPDPSDTTGQGPVVQVAVNVMRWILAIFTLLAVIAFVYTGFKYLTTMGDTYKAESAKNSLVYSIIGVAVTAGALILINTVDVLLR